MDRDGVLDFDQQVKLQQYPSNAKVRVWAINEAASTRKAHQVTRSAHQATRAPAGFLPLSPPLSAPLTSRVRVHCFRRGRLHATRWKQCFSRMWSGCCGRSPRADASGESRMAGVLPHARVREPAGALTLDVGLLGAARVQLCKEDVRERGRDRKRRARPSGARQGSIHAELPRARWLLSDTCQSGTARRGARPRKAARAPAQAAPPSPRRCCALGAARRLLRDSPASRLPLAYTSRPPLACLSPTSRLPLAHLSPTSRAAVTSAPRRAGRCTTRTCMRWLRRASGKPRGRGRRASQRATWR